MTCIVYCDNRIYADSVFVKDTEVFHSLTKIHGFFTPPHVKCEKEGFVIDDVLHGWAGTGGYVAMSKFAEELEELGKRPEPDFDGLFTFYKYAATLGLANQMGSLFEMMLLGEKYLHMFRFDNALGFGYMRYDLDQVVSIGGGGALWMNNWDAHRDPVRAMYEVFSVDPNSGGVIDCWVLKPPLKEPGHERGFTFRREGISSAIPPKYLRLFLDDIYQQHAPGLTHIHRGQLEAEKADLAKEVKELEEYKELMAGIIEDMQKELDDAADLQGRLEAQINQYKKELGYALKPERRQVKVPRGKRRSL